MPIHELHENGETYYRWGNSGKKYRTRAEAVTQMRAAFANGYEEKSDPSGSMVHSPAPLGNVSVAPSANKKKKPKLANVDNSVPAMMSESEEKMDTRHYTNPANEPDKNKPPYKD